MNNESKYTINVETEGIEEATEQIEMLADALHKTGKHVDLVGMLKEMDE